MNVTRGGRWSMNFWLNLAKFYFSNFLANFYRIGELSEQCLLQTLYVFYISKVHIKWRKKQKMYLHFKTLLNFRHILIYLPIMLFIYLPTAWKYHSNSHWYREVRAPFCLRHRFFARILHLVSPLFKKQREPPDQNEPKHFGLD